MSQTAQTLLIVFVVAPAAGAALVAGIRTARAVRARRAARATTSAEPSHPVEHVGATEEFAAELRGLRNIEVAPELVSDIEVELEWGLAWHQLEHDLRAELDRIFAPALAFADCANFDELRELVLA